MKWNAVCFTNFWKEKFRRIFDGGASYRNTMHSFQIQLAYYFSFVGSFVHRSTLNNNKTTVTVVATTNHTKLLRSECHTRRRWRHLAMNKCGFYTRAWATIFQAYCHVQTLRFAFTQLQLLSALQTSLAIHFSRPFFHVHPLCLFLASPKYSLFILHLSFSTAYCYLFFFSSFLSTLFVRDHFSL